MVHSDRPALLCYFGNGELCVFSLEIHLGNTSGHLSPSAHLVHVIIERCDRGDPWIEFEALQLSRPRARPSLPQLRQRQRD